MNPDTHLFAKAMNKAGVPVVLSPDEGHGQHFSCLYRNNPDGSIRWIWPAGLKRADFLKFYHVSGLRAWLSAYALRAAAAIGGLRLFSNGRFDFYTDGSGAKKMAGDWRGRWCFFTGTVGPNRKGILWNCDRSGGVFSKIALTKRAASNLAMEADAISRVQSLQLRRIDIPGAFPLSESCLQLVDLSAGSCRSNNWLELPSDAAVEWLQAGFCRQPIADTSFAKQLKVRLAHLSAMDDPRIPGQLSGKLRRLLPRTDTAGLVATSIAHGDFTPWNVLINGDRLAIIDWELSQEGMPALYDLFHYVYQSNILVKRGSYRSIRRELDEIFATEPIAALLRTRGLDPVLYERYYLLWTLSYYLELYSMQPEWHLQVSWLLQTWNEALSWQLRQDESPRQLLLGDLGILLNDTPHAVLKWRHAALESLPEDSDVDICFDAAAAPGLLAALRRHPLVHTAEIRHRSFMTSATLVLTDGSLLHIDLIYKFKRRELEFLDAATVLQTAVMSPYGFRVAAPVQDFLYTVLFYGLNSRPVPAHYRDSFSKASEETQADMLRSVNSGLGLAITSIREACELTAARRQTCTAALWRQAANTGQRGLANRCGYVLDTLRNFYPKKGFIITFSGVDGAGKSTVIEEVQRLIDKGLRRKVIVRRHRPSVLPILSAWKYGKAKASDLSAARLPRQGTNRSALSSLLRFAYYYLDYLIGQFYIQLRYVRRGYVVVYDRYYFDFIHDGLRSNIRLPKPFVRAGFRLLLKPALNFFLYADADTIYKRKQELDPDTIRELTREYLQHFESLEKRQSSARYISVENDSLQHTIQTIYQHIKQQAA